MSPDLYNLVVLTIIFFIIATLYSSIGFGGGSGYLAFLTLFLSNFFEIRSIALVCNLVVVTGSCYLYYKKGHLNFNKFLPFIITSIPMAFIGAIFRLEEPLFFTILGAALIISAVLLAWQTLSKHRTGNQQKKYPAYITYLIGGTVGFLSGMVGIGGGIFLAPVLNHMKWDKSIKIAALASFFILVNSISGITGLISTGTFEISGPEILSLVVAVFLGGQVGIRLSIKKLTGTGIKLMTALLVFIAGIRVFLIHIPLIDFR
jgi:uncharacterized membrane protein YfcA